VGGHETMSLALLSSGGRLREAGRLGR
jgi:hypothetical protein